MKNFKRFLRHDNFKYLVGTFVTLGLIVGFTVAGFLGNGPKHDTLQWFMLVVLTVPFTAVGVVMSASFIADFKKTLK